MEGWQKFAQKIKDSRIQKIKALPIVGKTLEIIEFIDTLTPIEIEYTIWGCVFMEYTVDKSNQFIKWKNAKG